jgi:hypothetical protein
MAVPAAQSLLNRMADAMTITRKPTLGLFGSTHPAPAVAEEPLKRRNMYLESLLCIAIRKRVLVKLQLKDYIAERLFEPTAVYLSRKHQLCVTCVHIADPEKPLKNLEVRHFEIHYPTSFGS